MERLIVTYSLVFLICFCLPLTFASEKSYVVYLGSHSHGENPTLLDLQFARNSHYELLGSVTESKEIATDKIFYSYTKSINGFAALLNDKEVEALKDHPDVVSVFPNRAKQLHTMRSWNFLGLETEAGMIPSSSLWKAAQFGKDVIIGNLDTGVYPESRSFNDEGIGPIPSRWRGFCQRDETKNAVRCNRKLIGAKYFNKGYAHEVGKLNSSFHTARDNEGHGTHTLSTAAGSFVPSANVSGYGNGTAKGGSPVARVAAYKVCWPKVTKGQCFDADILAGYDAAIHDRVDVLSVSLGSAPLEFLDDSVAIGAFHAIKRGINVIASAGNAGPDSTTISNVSPWMTTIGASSTDRVFTSWVILGNGTYLWGASLSDKYLPEEMFPLILASDAKLRDDEESANQAEVCTKGWLDKNKVKGKILVCLRGGGSGRAEKGEAALLAGAVAMVLVNEWKDGLDIIADTHVLPAAHISYSDGLDLYSYMDSTKSPMAKITKVDTYLRTKPAPFMAAFSSRGPNPIAETIIKPDLTAPGVSVIAAFSQSTSPTNLDLDKRRIPYNSLTGTSMSCPHVAGIAGLLKAAHPEWSPAAIRSAMMTTARTRDNEGQTMLDSSTGTAATPFDYGSGHVRPSRAVDPGLVYDLTVEDYVNFLCARVYEEKRLRAFFRGAYNCSKGFTFESFNYPSMSVEDSQEIITLTRRLKNVGEPATYTAKVKSPASVSVTVEPAKLVFTKLGEEKTFRIVFKMGKTHGEDYVFGKLAWTDGKHYVRSPLVVRRVLM